eukprot:CAMPEP_0194044692 /NCGR_PEP_ID=MMETSP0009_2-20130614/16123_1 /TAXON_ID=210454 /ORGANISM="Grammatophora oceanica, Strain CCMP 410" /LENGTH=312 /DNA_ID=CAMNT_0038689285 /DNA_START=14 /DNA_END=952 /DNA_ORIENTATION=+
MEPFPAPPPRPYDAPPLDDAQDEHQHATITLKPSCYTSTEALIHYQSKRIQSLELQRQVDEEELECLRRKYQELQHVHQMQTKEWEIRQEQYDKQREYLTDRMECFERYLNVVVVEEQGGNGGVVLDVDDGDGEHNNSSSVPMLVDDSVNSSSGAGADANTTTGSISPSSRSVGLFRSLRSSRSTKMDATSESEANDASSSSHPSNRQQHKLRKAQQTIRALMGQIQLVERMLGDETKSLREQLLQQQQVQVRMESEYQLQLQQLQHSKRQLDRVLLEHHRRSSSSNNNGSTPSTTAASSSTGGDTEATSKI